MGAWLASGGRAVSFSEDVPGSELFHPVAVGSLLLLILNDHLLKGSAMPSSLTGKLSDVAGLVVAPLVLGATVAWIRALLLRPPPPRPRSTAWLMVAVTAAAFTAIKLSPPAMELYRHTMGVAQWLPGAMWAVLTGSGAPPMPAVSAVVDRTDLVAPPRV